MSKFIELSYLKVHDSIQGAMIEYKVHDRILSTEYNNKCNTVRVHEIRTVQVPMLNRM